MKKDVKSLVYMSLYVALALVFDYVVEFIPFLNMPSGGTLNIAIIPIVVSSYHLGYKKGALVGILWWAIGFLFLGLNKWYLNPIQYSLDYIIPALILGFASVVPNNKRFPDVYLGVIFVCVVRFITTVLSGVYFYFPSDTVSGSLAAWIYSLNYNFWYNFGTLIVAIIIVPIIMKRLKPILHTNSI